MTSFTDRFATRPLSWSQLSSFMYSPAQWYTCYVDEVEEPPNAAMLMGTRVGDSIGTPDSLVPDLTPPGIKEYPLRASLGPIHLIGYADHYCPETRVLNENKTTDKPKKWTQKSVDEHGQLTMYALLLFLQDKVKPEDVEIWLNDIRVEVRGVTLTLPSPVQYTRWQTRRTTKDIMLFVNTIQQEVGYMEAYYKKRQLSPPTPRHYSSPGV